MKSQTLVAFALLAAISVPALARAVDVPGIRGEYLKSIADVQSKIVRLAEAMPEAKYSWRPGKGVRSVSEVYMHLAFANYILPTFTGAKMPEGVSEDMETKVTEKAKVVEGLKQSFAFLNQTITSTPDSALDRPCKTFLGEMSVREVFLTTLTHEHEHLGQSIAYARMNGVVPPWTADQQAADAKKAAEQAAAKPADKK